jgi:hypothetical protein
MLEEADNVKPTLTLAILEGYFIDVWQHPSGLRRHYLSLRQWV